MEYQESINDELTQRISALELRLNNTRLILRDFIGRLGVMEDRVNKGAKEADPLPAMSLYDRIEVELQQAGNDREKLYSLFGVLNLFIPEVDQRINRLISDKSISKNPPMPEPNPAPEDTTGNEPAPTPETTSSEHSELKCDPKTERETDPFYPYVF